MTHAVKFAAGSPDIIEGLGIPYGGPFNGKDIEGEFFTKSTDLALEWFGPGERPLLYHHGVDPDAGLSVVGRVTGYKATDKGVWAKAQLDRQSEYFDAIAELVGSGKLFYSSGAMAHLTQRKKSGEITRWPWIELSLTPTPANLLAELDFETAEEHFKAAGIKSAPLDELSDEYAAGGDAAKTMSESSDSSGGYNVSDNSTGASGRGEFAYVDSNGRGHLPVHDAGHVRAAMSRFDQTDFESPAKKKSAARKIVARARLLNIDVADDSAVSQAAKAVSVKDLPDGPTLMADPDGGPYPEGSYEDLAYDIAEAARMLMGGDCYCWVQATFPGYALVCCNEPDEGTQYLRIAYTLDQDGEPVLGSAERVTPAMVPAPMPMPMTDEAPLAIQSARLTDYAALVASRTKDVSDRRIKEGRVLSTSNRTRLDETATALEGALKALRDLLDATEPQPAKAASVNRAREAEALKLWGDALLDDDAA